MEIMFCQIIKHIIPFMVALLVLQSETGIQSLFGNLDIFSRSPFYSFILFSQLHILLIFQKLKSLLCNYFVCGEPVW